MKRNSNSIEPEFKKGLTEEEINSPEFNPDDFAPAPDGGSNTAENESLENRRNAIAFAFIVALFTLILGLVGWGASSAVKNYEDSIDAKIALSVFENCDRAEEYKANKEGYRVYAVFYKDKMAGYCVLGSSEGFGGKIDIAVAFNSTNLISNVKIIDHNESRGLGSKITTNSFLKQFKGLLIGNVGADYDIISGATTSSRAVGEYIRKVLGLGLSTESIAKELSYETITEEEIEEEVKKDEDSSSDPSDTTSSPETNRPIRPGDVTGGGNVNNGDGDIDIDGNDDTTVYDTETTEHEDETTVPEDTTAKPEETTKPAETTGIPDDTTGTEDTTAPVDSEETVDTTVPPITEDSTAPDSAEDTTAENGNGEAAINNDYSEN